MDVSVRHPCSGERQRARTSNRDYAQADRYILLEQQSECLEAGGLAQIIVVLRHALPSNTMTEVRTPHDTQACFSCSKKTATPLRYRMN